jgi:hypothetical protein
MKLVKKSWIHAYRHAGTAREFAHTETPHSTRIEGRGGERHRGGGRIHGKLFTVPLRQNRWPVWFQNQQDEGCVGIQVELP